MSNTNYGSKPQRLSCQPEYIRTPAGILKLIEFLCDAIALILGAATPSDDFAGQKGWFTFVAAFAIIITTVLLFLAFLNIQNLCLARHWVKIEMFICGFIALLFLIASIVAASVAKYKGVYGAAAFFGFAATITYIADAIYRFRLLRAGPRTRETYSTSTTVTREQPTY